MRYSQTFRFLCLVGLSLTAQVAQAADEDVFLGQLGTSSEQTMGYGRSAIWTLPLVATQYQPVQPTAEMQSAVQAQQEGRFLDALIILDTAVKHSKAGTETHAELTLLRASFLLQGNQSQQALQDLSPLLAQSRHAADAYALTAMALLQQEQIQEALDAAQRAHDSKGGVLPHLVQSYALQGSGHLAEALAAIHSFNATALQSAITLAREAELALTLNQIASARMLAERAHDMDASHPYVASVNGLVYLIDGQAELAKAAFEAALKRDPRDAKALLGLGLTETKLGNLKVGQEKLQAASEADPGNALILTYLGRAQQQSGQSEAARASWHRAQQADPKDPIPWLYQAQAELKTNHPLQARASLREAESRLAYRSVYRGERLLREDAQLLQANLAEVQRQLGLENLAFQTLAGTVGANDSANLRNQADILQGRRFGESARRSLLLQSQFGDKPGNLPPELDIYGDGAGQTGATTPQHGVVSGLGAQQASYNNYDELFSQRSTLEADAIAGSHLSQGEQVRLGAGNSTLGLGFAQRRFKTDGNAPFQNLDNRIWQGIVQWRPARSTQAFVSHNAFASHWGTTIYPANPWLGSNNQIVDNSEVTRLGLLHSLSDDGSSELRGLLSHQKTDQANDFYDLSDPPNFLWPQPGSSSAHSVELQYRRSGADYATQWGMLQSSGQTTYPTVSNRKLAAQHFYSALQHVLNPYLQLDVGLGWAKLESRDDTGGGNSTSLTRWLPQLAAVYTPDDATHLRFAAWHGMGVSGPGDATLAPANLAGVLLVRPDDNGKLVHALALAGDRQLNPAWLLAADAQRRQTDDPVIQNSAQIFYRQQVDESRLSLYWQPQGDQWTVGLANEFEHLKNYSDALELDSVQQQTLNSQQLSMRWFASAQLTANCTWSRNRVSGELQSIAPIPIRNLDTFNQLDADLNWQFNGSPGSLTVGVRNATNVDFRYTEIDKLNPRFSNGRMVYGRLKLAW